MGKYLKIGDVFEVVVDSKVKGYVQYIADDMTQLNSCVVRVFKQRDLNGVEPSIEDIVSGEVEFYAHVYNLKESEKDGTWKKIGKSENVGNVKKPLFRLSSDMGAITLSSPSHFSKNWYVWTINEETKDVSSDSKLLRESDYGSVSPSSDIVVRMKTGKSGSFRIKYEGEV